MRPITVLLLAGALEGCILSVLLFLRRSRNPSANRILAIILLLLAFSIGIHALAEWRDPADKVHYWLIGALTAFSAPLTRFYTLALAAPPLRFHRSDLSYFLPFVLLLAFSIILIPFPAASVLRIVFAAALDINILYYLVSSILICLDHARLVRQNYAVIGKRSLKWLLVFLIILVAVWGSMGIGDIVFPNESWDLFWTANCLLFFLMGLVGFQRPQFFESLEGELPGRSPPHSAKYRNSPLSRELLERFSERLNRAMAQRKPYLDGDLSLASLAEQVGITPHNLSQVLNEGLGMSFYDFVNGYRIREAQARLRSPECGHLTIASIAHDLGFNSLSAFNQQFRAQTGTTPSRYRDHPASD